MAYWASKASVAIVFGGFGPQTGQATCSPGHLFPEIDKQAAEKLERVRRVSGTA
jgi:hypothetical protein